MTRLEIVADPADAALHGLDGTFAWGEARTVTPGEEGALAADVVIELGPDGIVVRGGGEPASRAGGEVVGGGGEVVGGGGEAASRAGGEVAGGGGAASRRIATAGENLWRRAPFPANDALISLSPGAGVLVVGPGDPLRERGVPFVQAERLTAEALAAAAIVVFAGPPGAPLPAAAPAVLAAGRLLIVPRADPGFGLLAGVDHLAYETDYELAQLADAAATFPLAFEPIVAMGRLAARAQLASAVYGRLALDAAAS